MWQVKIWRFLLLFLKGNLFLYFPLTRQSKKVNPIFSLRQPQLGHSQLLCGNSTKKHYCYIWLCLQLGPCSCTTVIHLQHLITVICYVFFKTFFPHLTSPSGNYFAQTDMTGKHHHPSSPDYCHVIVLQYNYCMWLMQANISWQRRP